MSGQRRRAALTSVASTVVDAGLFSVCALFLMGPALLLARWSCGALGAVTNFTINRRWAFRGAGGHWTGQALRYGVTALVAVSAGTAMWWAMAAITDWDPRLLHLASLALAWWLVSFPLQRAWVFRTEPDLV